jgi:hypothetical protein
MEASWYPFLDGAFENPSGVNNVATESDDSDNVAASLVNEGGNETTSAGAAGGRTREAKAVLDIDLAYLDIDAVPNHYLQASEIYRPSWVKSMALHHNVISQLPDAALGAFVNMTALDVSNNTLTELPSSIVQLSKLRILIAKNNGLDSESFPKQFHRLQSLEVLNVGGNQLSEVPQSFLELRVLKALYMGSNNIKYIPCRIGDITTLEVLYLGGNRLVEIPATIGKLTQLSSLVLCDNALETIPSSVAQLQMLESLSLHRNKIRTLPPEILNLANLHELSLRGNPLVVRFARDVTFDVPSLKELSGRAVKLYKLTLAKDAIPTTLHSYLSSAHQCVNPKCKGVYFEARVEHVKFVDFCGKYRVPLMQYLCSPVCSDIPAYAVTESSSGGESEAEDMDVPIGRINRVLLG